MVFLSPLTSQLCCGAYLWKEAMNSRDKHSAEECQASLQHQRLFFSILPFLWSGTALQQQTPQPPDHAPKRKQPPGSPPRSHQGRPPAWELNPHWKKKLVYSQLWTLLPSSPANPRASGAFSGFKGCTWQQLLLCSCLNVWTPFSPPISELESWN